MQGVKYKYSFDALKGCYEINSDIYNVLTENHLEYQFFVFTSPNYKDVLTDNFRLRRVNDSKFDFVILVPDEKFRG